MLDPLMNTSDCFLECRHSGIHRPAQHMPPPVRQSLGCRNQKHVEETNTKNEHLSLKETLVSKVHRYCS